MTDVPVTVLQYFERSPDGFNVIGYHPSGDIYMLPHRVATLMAVRGKVEILELVQDEPKKKKPKTKKIKEPKDGE